MASFPNLEDIPILGDRVISTQRFTAFQEAHLNLHAVSAFQEAYFRQAYQIYHEEYLRRMQDDPHLFGTSPFPPLGQLPPLGITRELQKDKRT